MTKKRTITRITSTIMSAIIVGAALFTNESLMNNTVVYADVCFVDNETDFSDNNILGKDVGVKAEADSDNNNGYIKPNLNIEYNNITGLKSNRIYNSTLSQESYYRNDNVPTARNQKSYGTCWAFSATACIEINLIKKGVSKDINLSEKQLAYNSFHLCADEDDGLYGDDIVALAETGNNAWHSTGGNILYATNTLLDWRGIADESQSSNLVYMNSIGGTEDPLTDEEVNMSVAHLKQYRVIVEDNFRVLPSTEKIKNAIVEYGSVECSYLSSSIYQNNYEDKNIAVYCNEGKDADHAVVIVGWDNDFDADNFKVRPEGNGAWIVRNSWGSSWGNDGYFYLSYYDKSLCDIAAYDAVLDNESIKEYNSEIYGGYIDEIYGYSYDNIYQYDGAIESTETDSLKYANVFTAKGNGDSSDKGELIKAVSFEVMSAGNGYTVKVYKNITNKANPESGELVFEKAGRIEEAGAYNIPLENAVYIDKGVEYSVVVELDSGHLLIDVAKSRDKVFTAYSLIKPYQSFLVVDGAWKDCCDANLNGNVRIKAFTDIVDKVEPVLVEEITVNSISGENIVEIGCDLELNALITPSDASIKSLIWESSDSNIAVVDENGKVKGVSPGIATITARTKDESGKYGQFKVNVVKKLKDISIIDESNNEINEDKYLYIGDSYQLMIKYNPEDTTDSLNVTWSSSDETIAVVTENGLVISKNEGICKIYVKVGGFEKYITIVSQKRPEPETKPHSNIPETYDDSIGMGWKIKAGEAYWYEGGEKQGVKYNPDGSRDLNYRGKEIYDPTTNAWYWLDNVLDGAVAKSKDVYQESAAGQWADKDDGTGKWVRYDKDGQMVKGWEISIRGLFYFDPIYGTMAKGYATIEGIEFYFNTTTGVLENRVCDELSEYQGWKNIDGVDYWYENGVRQGYSIRSTYRGKEIYDPSSDAWYWLDNVDGGRKAVSKDVYQESLAGEWGDIEKPDENGNMVKYGKWVRYDENGHMIKGWTSNENGTYYFDLIYGTMAKGRTVIDGEDHYFNEISGVLEW